ncbi:MAG: hypothetical protein A2918_00640 [Candidatus Yanofskybacteria bacterium RIFCSPLOWO2_01_FULL_42_49]|uniref:DUF4878 domain-containing protein n=1 Tax=Candidatus Yanofskybacteria bacterium RIFCSPLOWO2_01_FULL_42_49 TaxID=1802694 RepID=A0A1F8GDW6_9BACT|nr:MAG: hypothetical protein A2918_00640 [Candidatus Yanofskybacteria bacterium RIFCSPLOWO2_01_FULL_42_49]
MLNWKNIFKGWAGVPVLILVVLAIVWFLPGYKSWQLKRAYDKVEEPYYADTYGGKTPEETYDMFIDALKKGDVELASKYFVVEDQEKWNKTLSEYKKVGSLGGFVSELEEAKEIWKRVESVDENTGMFEYEVVLQKDSTLEYESQKLEFPAGKYTNTTEFLRYPSGIWKIYAF